MFKYQVRGFYIILGVSVVISCSRAYGDDNPAQLDLSLRGLW